MQMPTQDDALTPAEAARDLAELSARRAQVVAEYAKGPPRWQLPLDMALASAFHAAKDLDPRSARDRDLRAALRAAELVAPLLRSSLATASVEADHRWIEQTLPEAVCRSSASATDDGLDLDQLMTPPSYGAAAAVAAAAVLGALLPGRVVPLLRRRGVRRANAVAGAVVAGTTLPVGALVARWQRRHADLARLLPDVGAAASLPASLAPAPAAHQLFRDPARLSLAGLLSPAARVGRGFVRTATGWDDGELATALAPLADAGFVVGSPTGWLRPARSLALTRPGRAALAAHAAALRATAYSATPLRPLA